MCIRDRVTRVLLERLIVNRPHPWGLLVTFIELIKSPRHDFWSHSFTRAAPEIERLFQSVARSCMVGAAAQQQQQAAQAQQQAQQQQQQQAQMIEAKE
jgi:CCR4-NOT transcription complex subunit 1